MDVAKLSKYTPSGARRTGDEYQDYQSAEILVEWLENPEAYHWVRLEAMGGSLDDIQAERADGTHVLLQVKFGTDASKEWEWDDLLEQKEGKRGTKLPSLIMKWGAALHKFKLAGSVVNEAALLTNRKASPAVLAHLSNSGFIDFNALANPIKLILSEQLGGATAASIFFASFRFRFNDLSIESLEIGLMQRFKRLGGTNAGWSNLIGKIRRWINRQDEPSDGGNIRLMDLRAASLWHLPPQIPQNFHIPADYIPPEAWSESEVIPKLRGSGSNLVVITGSPGAGKSTYLSWLVEKLRKTKTHVVRHHFFLSLVDNTNQRTAWETAANAIIGQLGQLGENDNRNPTPDQLSDFITAAGRKQNGKQPLVVIVDGLDHVWRDTGSVEELRNLFDQLLPVPDGVVVIVGTQDLDVAKLPSKLRSQCPRERWLSIPPLNRVGVRNWLEHHRDDLGLPEDRQHAERIIDDIGEDFYIASGGHPLVLHYTLAAVKDNYPVSKLQIRMLPQFNPGTTVATYYKSLWDDISSEGRQLLHLLAGFPWAWPRDGLVQCLASYTDTLRLEQAERSIRHVLGYTHAGITAFHESLLAFVRSESNHRETVKVLRQYVISWLSSSAPEYWRWRYEWIERANCGDNEFIIKHPNLEWCIDALAAGRCISDICDIISKSGWAALSETQLGITTERNLLDIYVDQAKYSDNVISTLLKLSLLKCDISKREIELYLFMSRKDQASTEEIACVAEVAFMSGRNDICVQLLKNCGDRWNALINNRNSSGDVRVSLAKALPLVIAASLSTPEDGPYQVYIREHNAEPSWCPCDEYSRALERCSAIGDSTKAIREELRFLANRQMQISYEAVDALVRLACQDAFDPEPWITQPEARLTGLFRCYKLWAHQKDKQQCQIPRSISFASAWEDRYSPSESIFAELTRAYFFSCLANVGEGIDLPRPEGISPKATAVPGFLSIVADIATEAAVLVQASNPVGGGWFLTRLNELSSPIIPNNDHDNSILRRGSISRIVVAIAQDLELLHCAHTGIPSLSSDVIIAAIDSQWTLDLSWVEDRVARGIKMSNPRSADVLTDRVLTRLQESREGLHERAGVYSLLAEFCRIHSFDQTKVNELVQLSARNLLGHGYHKDTILFDVISAIKVAHHKTQKSTLDRLMKVSTVIQIIDEITDGDETNHLKSEFSEIITDTETEAIQPYIQYLQRNLFHADVEHAYTYIASVMSFKTEYEKSLASTLVNEDSIQILKIRADSGDTDAAAVLADIMEYCGRSSPASVSKHENALQGSVLSQGVAPSIADYPPELLSDYCRKLREANIFSDQPLAEWTIYWISRSPENLLVTLFDYCQSHHGYPLETETALEVINLAFQYNGRSGAWYWLVTYHRAIYGFAKYYHRLAYAEKLWGIVRSRFADKWLEFIKETSRPRWGATGAPAWSIERMVLFLQSISKVEYVDEVLDTAVNWVSGLAADMQLPKSAIANFKDDLPMALRLLVGRLDCPSRMVQDRAIAAIAKLLAGIETSCETSKALVEWHATDTLEFRSCVLLLVLYISKAKCGASEGMCISVIGQANIIPSVGAHLLLCEFGGEVKRIASSLDYTAQHSGPAGILRSRVDNFEGIVSGYLAPIFLDWAHKLDVVFPFSQQWEWEASNLAQREGVFLQGSLYQPHHYRGGIDYPALSVSDLVSSILRSAYLRALHWAISDAILPVDRAMIHARRVAVMAEPELWAVRPSPRPEWWPLDSGETEEIDMLCEVVGQALRYRLEKRKDDNNELILYAAGPVGNRSKLPATLLVQAFLQSADGPSEPSAEDLEEALWVSCYLKPERMRLTGTYQSYMENAEQVRDWMVAPLAWRLFPDAQLWLQPERHAQGVVVPATWLFPGAPIIKTESKQVEFLFGDRLVSCYRYWNDELRERYFFGAGSRVGVELTLDRQWVEQKLNAGANLCWLANLYVAQRGKYEERFCKPQKIGSWIIGGSRIILQ